MDVTLKHEISYISDLTIGGCIKEEQVDETYKPTEDDKKNNIDNFGKKDTKIEGEDSLTFGGDAWLRHSVEIKDEEEFNSMKKEEGDVTDSGSDTNSLNNDTKRDVNEEAEEENEASQLIINKILKKDIRINKKAANDSMRHTNPIVLLKDCLKNQDDTKRIKGTWGLKNTTDKGKRTVLTSVVMDKSESSNAATGLNTFHCTICQSVAYKNWDSFSKHMKIKHQQSLKMSNHQKFLKESFYHNCRICLQKVLSSSVFLSKHLKSRHNIKVSEYKKQFNCTDDQKTNYERVLQKGRLSKSFIGNLCTFQCHICNQCRRYAIRYRNQFIGNQNCIIK